jgi:hypothetical protein
VGIDAMLVIEVDRLDAEPSEARVTSGTDVLGFATDAARVRIGTIADDGELRGQEDPLPPSADRPADYYNVSLSPYP